MLKEIAAVLLLGHNPAGHVHTGHLPKRHLPPRPLPLRTDTPWDIYSLGHNNTPWIYSLEKYPQDIYPHTKLGTFMSKIYVIGGCEIKTISAYLYTFWHIPSLYGSRFMKQGLGTVVNPEGDRTNPPGHDSPDTYPPDTYPQDTYPWTLTP